MERALDAYKSEEAGINEISRRYRVPKATLLRHLMRTNKYAIGSIKQLGRQPSLPIELENLLAKYIQDLDTMLFGISRKYLMSLAYQIADKNKLRHMFNNGIGFAGKHWYHNFMKRHPELSFRKPEATSLARAIGFNKDRVGRFFTLLEQTIERHHLDGTRIFNMDESGITTVQKPGKVISVRGKKTSRAFN